jgi:hypothetical protein
MRFVISALSILFTVSSAVARDKAKDGPDGSAPIFKFVSRVDPDKGIIEFKDRVLVPVIVTKQIIENINGKDVVRTVTEQANVMETRISQIEIANKRFLTANGKAIPMADLWKRVKANTVVVISGDFDTPSEEYLRVLNPEAVVIVPVFVLDKK